MQPVAVEEAVAHSSEPSEAPRVSEAVVEADEATPSYADEVHVRSSRAASPRLPHRLLAQSNADCGTALKPTRTKAVAFAFAFGTGAAVLCMHSRAPLFASALRTLLMRALPARAFATALPTTQASRAHSVLLRAVLRRILPDDTPLGIG